MVCVIEARQRLAKVKPLTIGQAKRISGVNPNDIIILMTYLRRYGKMKNNPFLQYLDEHFSENAEVLKVQFAKYAALIEEHNKVQKFNRNCPKRI